METPEKGNGTPAVEQGQKSGAAQEGGGVTGFIKSLVSGTPVEQPKESDGAVKADGGSASAPTSLSQGGQQAGGVAGPGVKGEESPYAPALDSISGSPNPADPSQKYGTALDPIANPSASTASGGGVVGAVTAAAGSAVESIKQAAGYGTTAETDAKGPDGAPVNPLSAEPAAITAAELPKSGVVNPHDDGTVEIKPASTAPIKETATPAAGSQVTPTATEQSTTKVPSEAVTSTAATSTTGSKTAPETKAAASKPETKPSAKDNEAEKAKAPTCGCCVIS